MAKTKPNYKNEDRLNKLGFDFVAGVDEAGRGALAGPLVASCVILNRNYKINLLNDSKLLSAKQRVTLARIIKVRAISWSIGISTASEINKYGIQPCTYMAFQRAIAKLSQRPDYLLIDHYRLPDSKIPQTPITKGDQISASISAASILAKVYRDNKMLKLSSKKEYLKYNFERNKGYGTSDHLRAIRLSGPSKIHRNNFIGIDKKPQTVLNLYKDTKKEIDEKNI